MSLELRRQMVDTVIKKMQDIQIGAIIKSYPLILGGQITVENAQKTIRHFLVPEDTTLQDKDIYIANNIDSIKDDPLLMAIIANDANLMDVVVANSNIYTPMIESPTAREKIIRSALACQKLFADSSAGVAAVSNKDFTLAVSNDEVALDILTDYSALTEVVIGDAETASVLLSRFDWGPIFWGKTSSTRWWYAAPNLSEIIVHGSGTASITKGVSGYQGIANAIKLAINYNKYPNTITAGVSFKLDLTNVSYIKWDAKTSLATARGFHVYVNSDLKLSTEANYSSWTEMSVNVSSYSGVCTIQFKMSSNQGLSQEYYAIITAVHLE